MHIASLQILYMSQGISTTRKETNTDISNVSLAYLLYFHYRYLSQVRFDRYFALMKNDKTSTMIER